MDAQHPPISTSFVIRFVVQEPPGAAAAGAASGSHAADNSPYRGVIRHVQSDETINFSAWGDAVEFIRRFVPLEPQAEE